MSYNPLRKETQPRSTNSSLWRRKWAKVSTLCDWRVAKKKVGYREARQRVERVGIWHVVGKDEITKSYWKQIWLCLFPVSALTTSYQKFVGFKQQMFTPLEPSIPEVRRVSLGVLCRGRLGCSCSGNWGRLMFSWELPSLAPSSIFKDSSRPRASLGTLLPFCIKSSRLPGKGTVNGYTLGPPGKSETYPCLRISFNLKTGFLCRATMVVLELAL